MERDYLIKPLLGQHYPMISHGKGVYLFDKDGNRYIDGSSGAITVGIGHGVEEIIDVMTEQAKQVSFVYRSQFTSEPAEKLAKKLSEITQGDLNWTFFVNSGTEATETAMKLAIQHYQEKGMKGKNKILSRWMSYHGITIGALSMSGHPLRRQRFVPILEDYPSVSPPYCYRCPFNLEHPSCDLACASELETAIDRIGSEHIAAFIAEPIIGAAGGAIVPSNGYYQRIKAICEKYDILLIADEVMTGLGRTGKMFAMEHWGVQPDIITLGKGLTSGYTPMAATIASDRVIEPIMQGSKLVMSGHTFSANPLSAAVSLAVIEYVEKHNLVQAAEEKGNYMLNKLQGLKEKFPFIGDVRGKGLLIGIEFINDIKSSSFIQKVMGKGLLLYPSVAGKNGKEDSAFMIAPPLTITYGELDELLQILTEGLKELEMEQSHLTYTAKGEIV
ncbi:aspartate aminotransferase family protein [Gottfriedia acidiceleris]|uniref:Aspartate aminotransferase family protein n=1 Tax=Gottfriedia acidiceleris TaxID=371036 RepID=A0ABY4JLE6_9BACI|nr:aspartate aminotransferase family protein [Gottfriedia acidiceleris]UPM54644.1 aspartate aminotransferase family protein [Gottfriedia acidiceleris]